MITGVAARKPQRLAQLVCVDAYLPIEGKNEITTWPTPVEGNGTDFISHQINSFVAMVYNYVCIFTVIT